MTVPDKLRSEKPPFIHIYHYQLEKIWQTEPATMRPLMLTVYCYLTKCVDARAPLEGAWPSQGTIARKTGISRASVVRAVQALADGGLLTVTPRRNAGGHITSSLYILTFDPPLVSDSNKVLASVSDSDTGCISQQHGLVADRHTNKNHLEEEPIEEELPSPSFLRAQEWSKTHPMKILTQKRS